MILLCQRLKKAIGSRKKKYLWSLNLVEIGERKSRINGLAFTVAGNVFQIVNINVRALLF